MNTSTLINSLGTQIYSHTHWEHTHIHKLTGNIPTLTLTWNIPTLTHSLGTHVHLYTGNTPMLTHSLRTHLHSHTGKTPTLKPT